MRDAILHEDITAKPDWDEAYHPILDEMQKRPVRVKRLDVIRPEAKDGLRPLEGTMVVAFARKGTGGIGLIRSAVEGGPEDVARLYEELKRQHLHRKQGPLERAVEMVTHADVFADIRYGGTTISHAVFLPADVDLSYHTFPYSGGRLALEGFELVEYYRPGSDASLDAVVLRADPPLTAAEQAALGRLPASELETQVGRALSCRNHWTTVAVAATVVIAAVLVTLFLACLSMAPEAEIHLSEDELKRLGPSASARKLLAMREEFIAQGLARRRAA